ncbi:MAG TPA: hypothetical protein VJH22_02470 [Candidatus Nanoarchaeia archaeon]|nr:hypothetical protein [Candidatus Nanoarchaeia archaeon]
MISITAQQSLLLAIAQKLNKTVTVYAIGGTAMMFHGLKDTTLDVDLVFENTESRDVFKGGLIALGYKKMDSVIVYGKKKNHPEMFTLGKERFDLFVNDVIDFVFSKSMQERATATHQFEKNLILKIADPHDLILMKCATDRLKDKDDARNIIQSRQIRWDILIKEAQNQIILGRETAVFDLGEFLEHLKEEMNIAIPQAVLNTLFEYVERQAEAKIRK